MSVKDNLLKKLILICENKFMNNVDILKFVILKINLTSFLIIYI